MFTALVSSYQVQHVDVSLPVSAGCVLQVILAAVIKSNS